MSKDKLEMRLYEFPPEIEALRNKIADSIDEDGQWIGDASMEEVIQQLFNMERDKKDKIISIGKLVKHFSEIAELHTRHADRHKKLSDRFEKQAESLKQYILDNTTEEEKYKDAEVSIYPHKSGFIIPSTTIEETPAEYRRPTFVSGYDRTLADRIETGCKLKGLPSPFKWEHDKEKISKEIKEGKEKDPNFQHPYGRKEQKRTIVVR